MIALILDYTGRVVKAYQSPEQACLEIKRLNDALSPWEKMAGYYYSLSGEIELVKAINDNHDRHQAEAPRCI
jgi:hypothetical protein